MLEVENCNSQNTYKLMIRPVESWNNTVETRSASIEIFNTGLYEGQRHKMKIGTHTTSTKDMACRKLEHYSEDQVWEYRKLEQIENWKGHNKYK